MLCHFGCVSVYSLCGSLSVLLLFISRLEAISHSWFAVFVGHSLATHLALALWSSRTRPLDYQIAWRSALLGEGMAFGLLLTTFSANCWPQFGVYLFVLSAFHVSEYLITALINAERVSIDSFLLNHSREYGIAVLVSVLEFIVEAYWLGHMKSHLWCLTLFGLIICVCGDLFRKTAMITAKNNFSHVIQTRRRDEHVLVTHGVYALCRHPSYVGWFYWSIGTQIILLNPFCAVGYAIASWKFFAERVNDEEITLINFFGEDYRRYKKNVKTGLPFIDGFNYDN